MPANEPSDAKTPEDVARENLVIAKLPGTWAEIKQRTGLDASQVLAALSVLIREERVSKDDRDVYSRTGV